MTTALFDVPSGAFFRLAVSCLPSSPGAGAFVGAAFFTGGFFVAGRVAAGFVAGFRFSGMSSSLRLLR